MRLLYVITDLHVGGVPLHLQRLARALQSPGTEVGVVSLAPLGDIARHIEDDGVAVQSCDASSPHDPRVLWRLRRHIKAFRPDLVHAFLFHANLACRLVGPLAGVKPGRLICEIQTVEVQRRWHLALDRWTRRLCACEVGNSPAVIEHLSRSAGLPEGMLRLIPGGVALSHYDDAEPLPAEALLLPPAAAAVLWVGRLDPAKGLDTLLEALSLLPDALGTHLLLAGEGMLRGDLERQIARLDLAPRVRLLGNRTDVPRLLKTCDVFVFPSRTEGMPNALLEAMAAGRAILCSDIPAHRFLIEDGISGLLHPVDRPDTIARLLQELLEDAALRTRLGRAARESVSARFSNAAMFDRYLELYRTVLYPTEPPPRADDGKNTPDVL